MEGTNCGAVDGRDRVVVAGVVDRAEDESFDTGQEADAPRFQGGSVYPRQASLRSAATLARSPGNSVATISQMISRSTLK